MGARVTAQEVARRAGVSQSAVSRAFSPGASVSEATAQKVRTAAEALGYRPNVLARAMITGRSRIVGVVVAAFDNQFYPQAVERLSVALQAEGFHVLMFMASPTVGDVGGVMQEILDYQVEGIVLVSVSISSVLAGRCVAHGIPVVLFNRDQGDDRLAAVTTDNEAGSRAVTEHLLTLGRRRIAFVAGFEGASTQRDREAGFRSTMDAAGLEPAARLDGDFSYERAFAATAASFARSVPPDAVFACSDHMAFGVIDALRSRLSLRVPEDVAVAGFDDVPLAAWPAYDLTTYRQPLDAMVGRTVAGLVARIADPVAAPRRERLPGGLVVRGSTDPARRLHVVPTRSSP